MIKLNYLLVATIFIAISSCSTVNTPAQSIPNTIGAIPVIDLCDLPNYIREKVYLKASSSGSKEHWSLNSSTSSSCSNKLQVDLDFQPGYKIPADSQLILTEVSNDSVNSYLIIEAIGVYEFDRITGDKHSGSNKSRFLVTEIVKLKTLKIMK